MKRNVFWINALLLVTLMVLASCGKRHRLEVNKSLIVFSFANSTDILSIEAESDWTIDRENTADWVTINPLSGSGNAVVSVTVDKNSTAIDRRTSFEVVNDNGKIRREVAVAQSKIDINAIARKVWFLRTYERWDYDYYNELIPESYRSYTYYSNPGYENWFFYFLEDSTGYQIRTFEGDTIYYAYDYVYFPEGDSLNITFETTNDSVENYHAVIHELNLGFFSFSDAYRPHQYEKLNLYNVTGTEKRGLTFKPKKTEYKPSGPLIQLK